MHTRELNKNDKIKEEIIHLLQTHKHMAFGDLVRNLSKSYEIVLRNVMDLKKQGVVKKHSDNGHFTLI